MAVTCGVVGDEVVKAQLPDCEGEASVAGQRALLDSRATAPESGRQ